MRLRSLGRLKFIGIFVLVVALAGFMGIAQSFDGERLYGDDIPKFTNKLIVPPVYAPDKTEYPGTDYYEVSMKQFKQDLGIGEDESGKPLLTTVWGYGGKVHDPANPGKTINFWNFPAATFEARTGRPIKVKWINDIRDFAGTDPGSASYGSAPFLTEHPLTVDHTIHGAETDTPEVKTVVHLHGGEVAPEFDGYPEDWYTANPYDDENPMHAADGGNYDIYEYLNNQRATTLWYHDHALGTTRLNVHMGLAGFYLLRNPAEAALNLPSGNYEVPIVIQDRSFNKDGSFFRAAEGSGGRPFWEPEFFGDTIIVNGKAWPHMNVEPTKYRLRLLNGSDSRFYAMKFVEDTGTAVDLADLEDNPAGPDIVQIGTDGGLLEAPVIIANRLIMGPGERADVVIDFSSLTPGKEYILINNAGSPFRGPGVETEEPADLNTGQIMKFKVVAPAKGKNINRISMPGDVPLPPVLDSIPTLTPTKTRVLTLNEVMAMVGGEEEPVMALLNNSHWMNPDAVETPTVGATELWEVINLTGDTHPIHTHLVQFQILNRQPFGSETAFEQYIDAYNTANVVKFGEEAWMTGLMNGHQAVPDVASYLGAAVAPEPNEEGWKDTIHMHPGTVTRILVRFAPQDGGSFTFDSTTGNYVWHCHILAHEDNEMMLPYRLINP